MGIKAGAKAGLSTNAVEDHQVKESLGFVDDKSVTVIGTEARRGWQSGSSAEGKGIISFLNLK